MLNKKGMLYEVGLVFFVIIILSAALYNILTSKSLTSELGKTSANIIHVDEEARLRLDLIEKSSTYYIYNAVIDLAANSGYNKDQLNSCKDWNQRNECILNEEKLKENLRTYLRSSFNDLTKKEGLNFYDIDLKILDNKIIVNFNANDIKFTNDNVEYITNHKFQKQVTYNLYKIDELFKKFSKEDKLESCPNKETPEDKDLLEPTCTNEKDFLSFELKQNKFYLRELTLEYPVQPIIKFKIRKLYKPTAPEQ